MRTPMRIGVQRSVQRPRSNPTPTASVVAVSSVAPVYSTARSAGRWATYRGMTHFGNPALETFAASTPISLTASDCQMHLFPNPRTVYSDCDRIQDFLSKRSLSYTTVDAVPGAKPTTRINDAIIDGWDEPKLAAALKTLGYPATAKADDVNVPMLILLVFLQVLYVTMVYGPIAAFLVELFPTRIRYTSMSLPYHIGNGWFGGMLPLTAAAIVAANGNIYAGLWYPVIVAALTAVIGLIFIRETKDDKIVTLTSSRHS